MRKQFQWTFGVVVRSETLKFICEKTNYSDWKSQPSLIFVTIKWTWMSRQNVFMIVKILNILWAHLIQLELLVWLKLIKKLAAFQLTLVTLIDIVDPWNNFSIEQYHSYGYTFEGSHSAWLESVLPSMDITLTSVSWLISMFAVTIKFLQCQDVLRI